VSPALRERLFSADRAFDHPVTAWAVGLVAAVLAVAPLAALILRKTGKLDAKLYGEVMLRWRSWLGIVALMLAPILLGPVWVVAAVVLLSVLCYSEFARATGAFREKTVSLIVGLGILLVAFAAFDHWPRLFFASAALTSGLIAVATIPQDRPKGYVQRVALGVLGFLLFGYCLGYLGLFANAPDYRPMLILLLLGVGLNDVFAFCTGKLIGGPKLLPNTSPNKTVAGAAGALVLTTALVAALGHFVFAGTAMDRPVPLLVLGAGLSVLGQLGDLLVSSVKRDVGVKDIGATIPGHGGLLDRFDSLVLVPPAAYHFLSLVLGPLGAGQPERIFSGG
jgi:phosphatidate cytidylyltransferase